MIYSIFSKKDSTIYEGAASSTNLNTEYTNTGIDEVLTIEKIVSSSKTANTYNSRALVQFNIDWSKINGGSASSAASNSMYLNLSTISSQNISNQYSIEARPISESWVAGLGRFGNKPKTLDGVSWKNRQGDGTAGTPWLTSSFTTQGTGSNGQTNSGGGTWYTSSYATQSFTYESTDIRMDVTDVTLEWSSSVIPNNGFIIKRRESQELDSSDYGQIKFFSENTHTVYPPRLEICWDDQKYTTGSLSVLDMSDTGAVFFYLKNNSGVYKRGGKIKFNINGRLKYPVKTYGNTSAELDVRHVGALVLQYSIIDCKTEEVVIPYDSTYTALSCNAAIGNYFEIYSDSLFEERHYKIQLRYRPNATSTDYSYYDIKDTFEVVR